MGSAAPEHGQPAREPARRHRAAVPAQDAGGEPIPEVPPLEEQIGRRGGRGRQNPRFFVARFEDGDELARKKAQPLGGDRRKRGHRALAQNARFAEHPVEQRPLHLLERPGETAERARRVNPHQRLGVEQERLQHLQRAPDELGIGGGRHAPHAHFETPRRQHATAQRAVRRPADHLLERLRRSPQPFSERGHLARARAGLPNEDFEARAGLGVLRQRQTRSRRRAAGAHAERVDERPLDDALARRGYRTRSGEAIVGRWPQRAARPARYRAARS